ncbi:peptidase associated/transthyretin-like domain-containing protein [Oceanomicrobium pacificus]|uniref:Twin-arginine translocation pathway signal n=1 Tax=Oceanomicrobium pacificus TaxID=2692916 RepID=A0A6B0TKS3_9RHOB|nr:twin-arginine translocation pathway signal [Oceanomicrobium pacificus]MXU65087.1 twin-arginine translocation pathway signal [Oceanomicrobium pacificus]
MQKSSLNRRTLLAAAGATALVAGPARLLTPAMASGRFAPTETMRGGANNYMPNAPFVDRLGKGFLMSGRVMRAGDGAPLGNIRIQIWAATTLGGEREPRNHGSVLTGPDGRYQLEMEQIVPNFGQPHAHLAYDDGAFRTVFLRPVMPSPKDTSLTADFILDPA